MSVRTQTELPLPEVETVRSECPPSSVPLRESVAKVCKHKPSNGTLRVPVVDKDQKPLMPTTPRRARKMIKTRKATPFWSKGIFCIRLNTEPSDRNTQPVVVGVDPGSKKEGLSVVSKHMDFLHVQLDARHQVKDKMTNRAQLRRTRRGRNTPCRPPRWNRASLRKDRVPPSTKARWDWKLRVLKWLMKLYPVSQVVVEDIKAKTKRGQKKWNRSFSPLEVGKNWFYTEVLQLAFLSTRKGWETKELREKFRLKKTSRKKAEIFEAHCVDSWVLAADALGITRSPQMKKLLCLVPLNFRRRSLHLQIPQKGNKRRVHGGTRSLGWRKGALVKSEKFGVVYLGGSSAKGRVSLHHLGTGKRLTQDGMPQQCRVLGYNSMRFYLASC